MSRVVHFEIPADDTGRCEAFYREVFGWDFRKWDGPMEYWMVATGAGPRGIDGGMMQRQAPGQGVVNTIEVESLDAVVQKVVGRGGAVAVPRSAIPGVGWIAYCTDTESNLFGLMQPDEAAK